VTAPTDRADQTADRADQTAVVDGRTIGYAE